LVYPELLSRMDDTQNSIRMRVASLFVDFVQSIDTNGMQDRCNESFDEHIWQHILNRMILHMDDPEISVQVKSLYEF
jgi:hypothetical protein